jgi:4-azaleucine resistance transporter AzlC
VTAEPSIPTDERRRIVRDGVAVGVASGAYGVSFGALGVAAGLSVTQTCVMSLLMFTGASQFAMVGVVAAGGPALSGSLTALLLGSRNTLYGLRMKPLLGWHGWRRTAAAQLLIDESTAMSVNRDTRAAARVGFLSTGIAVFVLWNLATFLGALAGRSIGNPKTYGLDAAVGGAFLALLWPRLKAPRNRVLGLLAAAVALGVVPVTKAGIPVLVASIVALVAGVVLRGADPTEFPSGHDGHEGRTR